jgi:hypothetical protein
MTRLENLLMKFDPAAKSHCAVADILQSFPTLGSVVTKCL